MVQKVDVIKVFVTLKVPSIVANQGEEAEELSRERRKCWIGALSRDGMTDSILATERVCQGHFVSGRAAKSWDKFNFDLVPTLNLVHTKKKRDRDDREDVKSEIRG